jgi:hypothetical protein
MEKPTQVSDADILRYARSLLVEKGWCKGAYARDEAGIPSTLGTGISFCAGGAHWKSLMKYNIRRLSAEGHLTSSFYLLDEATPRNYVSISDFNDAPETTLDDVLALYDRAIAAAEAK